MKFGAYLFVAAVVAGILYPIAGHWSWADRGGSGGSGWLADLGFVGSIVYEAHQVFSKVG